MEYSEKIINLIKEFIPDYEAKRKDYGNSFEDSWDLFGATSSLIRIYDKVLRLINLTKYEGLAAVTDETREDTYKDLIGYCFLSILKMRGTLND